MIERQKLDGRMATIAYLNEDFTPGDRDAPYAKVIFDDGNMLFLILETHAKTKDVKLSTTDRAFLRGLT